MPHKYIIAIDQGTSSTRIIVVDHAGKVVAEASRELRQIYPHPGWVEHDPLEVWSHIEGTLPDLVTSVTLDMREIAAIGITNQRETTVVWDRQTGQPLHNAIVWQCRRTAPLCDRLRQEGLAPKIREKTGLMLDPYFSATKIRWLLDNVDGARAKAAAGGLLFGTMDTWLLWKLTGGRAHITDHTNASRTMLYNLATRTWDDELLELFQVPRPMLPSIRSSSEAYAQTSGTEKTPAGLLIGGIAGDQQAALFGQACFYRGSVKNTYGTGCFVLMHTGTVRPEPKAGLLATVACGPTGEPQYALEGSVFAGGAAVQWLRDGLGLIQDVGEAEQVAQAVPNAGGVYLVPAFVGLGAPYWDPHARGAILGLTRGTRREHVVRAALEGIAHQSADVIEAMSEEAGAPIQSLRVDGGASRNNFIMQFQADILGVPVERPANTERTALGAAYLAGLASGFWLDADEVASLVKIQNVFEPEMPHAEREVLREGWRSAIARVRSRPQT
jgi:glycerol kinase